MDEASKMFIKLSANKFQAMRVFIEASETHESEISKMFLPTDNPLFFQLKVDVDADVSAHRQSALLSAEGWDNVYNVYLLNKTITDGGSTAPQNFCYQSQEKTI